MISSLCLSMIFSEHPFPLCANAALRVWIMLRDYFNASRSAFIRSRWQGARRQDIGAATTRRRPICPECIPGRSFTRRRQHKDCGPLFDVGADEVGKFLCRAANRLDALPLQRRTDLL